MATSLYLHIPFCVVKCGYCDFNSYVVEDEAPLDAFLQGIETELARTALPDPPTSVFLGGGTPSYLDEARLERLFAILHGHFDLAAIDEVTMEANPESVSAAKARIARAAGVNRVSLGAQTFDPAGLRFLDRAHDGDQTRAAVEAMRNSDFENLSLDLMFGLPDQPLEAWQRDLDAALELSPDHLSCYNLTYEPGTRLTRDMKRGAVIPNPPEVDRDMFTTTRDVLGDAGFRAYEISNFAGRGGPCRHNEHYWKQGDYVGIGPGAATHRQGVRWTNLKPLDAWGAALRNGTPAAGEAETLSPRQRVAEALWLGIRREPGVDLDALAARLGPTHADHFAPELDSLCRQGLLERHGPRVALTARGLLVADSIGERLLTA